MLLSSEKSIKIPKGALNVLICRHFLESKLDKDLSELVPYLQQWMEIAGWDFLSKSREIINFEIFLFPRTIFDHLWG